jgi:hypothetical protein
MKTGKESIQAIWSEIDRQNKAKVDLIAPTPKLEMVTRETKFSDDKPVVHIPEIVTNINDERHNYGIWRTGHDHIAGHTKIQKQYYDRMLEEAPELLATNVNHWFNKNPELRMIRTLDSNVRAMLSPRYRPLDNYDLGLVIFNEMVDFKGELILASSEITEKKLYLKFVMPGMTAPVRVGDMHSAGVIVANSEIGFGRIKIEPFIYRLRCTNGMIASDVGLKKNHVGRQLEEFDEAVRYFADETRQADDRAFYLKVRDVFRATLSGDTFNRQINLLQEATEEKIEGNLEGAVEVIANTFAFTEDERIKMADHFLKEADFTKFGIANAITRTAEDLGNYDRATEFEKFGGEVIVMPKTDWNRIANASAPEEKKKRGRKPRVQAVA